MIIICNVTCTWPIKYYTSDGWLHCFTALSSIGLVHDFMHVGEYDWMVMLTECLL